MSEDLPPGSGAPPPLLVGDLLGPSVSPLQADQVVQILANAQEAPTQRRGPGGNLFVLITMALFVLSFFGDWSGVDLAVLVAVVLVHEAGHALAMKLSGYRDVQVFFVPFFGGAAVGRPTSEQPFKSGLVDLAGPVPGILLATALLLWGPGGDVVSSAIGMLLLINVLNLLPMTPLDGGRLLETTLTARHPMLEALVGFTTAALFAWGAIAWRDLILGFLAFIALRTAISASRHGGRARRLRTEWPAWPYSPADLSPAQRLALVTAAANGEQKGAQEVVTNAAALHTRARRRFPGVLGTLILLGIWAAAFGGGFSVYGLSQGW